jgi:CelD/BcsL family acetyltransferase involved in cellulose biosynthesis
MDVCLEVRTALAVEECGSDVALKALQAPWKTLWLQCPQATLFQSPEWLIPWWKHLGEGELWVLTVWQDHQLVGLAPLLIDTDPVTSARIVYLLGTGITDYLDMLFLPGFEREGVAAIISYLECNRHRWDNCDFQQLSGSSALLEVPAAPDWTSEISVQEVCPVLKLPPLTSELPAQVPTRMLDKLKNYRRRLTRIAALQVEAVHQARWGARGQNGALETAELQAFHREAAWNLLSMGVLRLYALTVRDQIAATLYGFSHGGRAFYYLSGFDPELAEFGPGTLMIGHAIEQAIHERLTEFDFLRGRDAYKYMWGAKGRLNYRRQFAHSEAA